MDDERPRDEGFTLVEVLVAVAIIGIVMTSLTSFFVTSLSAITKQNITQSAISVADDGTERIRALNASAVLTGRDKTSSDTQWGSPVTGVAGYLADMNEAYDPTAAAGAGASAVLPTSPLSVTVGAVAFQQSFYVGRCYQPAAGGSCGAATDAVPFLRVVVAVTWPCVTAGTCAYVTSTLVSDATDPLFNLNDVALAPQVDDPGTQTSDVSTAIAGLQCTSTGGTPALTWSAAGLPTGLTMNSSGLVTGTPTATGSYTTVLTVTDAWGNVGHDTFSWTVNTKPSVTRPADQTGDVNVAATSVQVAASGGTGSYTWSASGLPAGLSINAGTGVISGTPTATGTATVTVTATDAVNGAASTTFNWTVAPAPSVTLPTTTARSSAQGSAIANVQATVSGGIASYTWSATNLPNGLSISASGLISGTPSAGTQYLTTVKVTDGAGLTSSVTFTWAVTSSSALRVTSPSADRTDAVNSTISFNANTAGGTGTKTWTASGLPAGMTLNASSGLVSGKPTTKGTYVTSLVVTDGAGAKATFMFTWTVQ